MRGTYFYSIKDLSKPQCRSIAYYFYHLCKEIDDYRYVEESYKLYKALVKALDLEEHSNLIIESILKKFVNSKILTPKRKNTKSSSFYIRGKVINHYKEDENIVNKCGGWNPETNEDINLIRAVFAEKQEWFPKIIAYTFFFKSDKRRTTFDIPSDSLINQKKNNNSFTKPFVQFMIDNFQLNEIEGRILNISFLGVAVKELHHLFTEIISRNEVSPISLFAKCTNYSTNTIRMYLNHNKKLVSFGLMDINGDISDEARNCIYNHNIETLYNDVLQKDEKHFYNLNSFNIKEDEIKLAARLLTDDTPVNLLLYGSPGAGKTQFARSLVHSLNLKPLIFKNELEIKDDKSENPALCKLNSLLSLNKSDTVIIVDEAEGLLKTQGSFFGMQYSLPQKGLVNKMLEESHNKVIWILNYTHELDESTKRRFNYAIKFNEMTPAMLKSIADSKLHKIKMSKNLHSEIVDLCGKYHVTGASVENIVKTVSKMDLTNTNETQVLNDVKKVLESNSTLIFGRKKMRDFVRPNYDLSVLNTTTSATEIVEMILNAQHHAEINDKEDNGIRILFYGLSGTGKTEFARYIAEELNKKIILKRPSDILGKYVGEDEANIRKAFEQAETTGDVLLFDEADTFFADRTNLVQSWERSLVNEFLTQMEEFSGILICTTNLRQIMDPAMQRRFHILTEFKPLAPNGIEILLKRYFNTFEFNQNLLNQISKYDTVTPGDFGQLSGKIRFMSKDTLSSEKIINELCKIQEEKESNHRNIGFAG